MTRGVARRYSRRSNEACRDGENSLRLETTDDWAQAASDAAASTRTRHRPALPPDWLTKRMLHRLQPPPAVEVRLERRRNRGRQKPKGLKTRDFRGVLPWSHDFVEQSRRSRD